MTLDPDQVAARLEQDHAARRRLVPFARDAGARTLADAYAIQDALCARMGTRLGGHVGWKIGLTSPRMQAMCEIPHPVAGRVFARRVLPSGAALPLSGLLRMGLEFEICVRLDRALPARSAPWSREEVAAAVGAVCPAVEVIDDRLTDYPLDPLSLVADNAWNEGLVLGPWATAWPDLAQVRGVVEVDGAAVDSGHGRDVLGHPFEPLTWLANHLSTRGEGLGAGELVSTGSLVTTRFPAVAGSFRFVLEGIGAVELRVQA
jgi:2-keto-4-pentenoate hydratase